MSTFPFLLVILMMSSILCFMMNSWILIWVMLEMNTLCFCSLMKTFSSKKKEMSESAMKYFIIQSISSAMLIFASMSLKMTNTIINSFMMMSSMALMIKVGSTPFHQWFINIVKKAMWKNNTILMTWQKLAPVYLVLYQTKYMIMPFILMSAVVGALSQMNKKNSMEIMGFSSVFNLSWMLLAVIMNTHVFIIFCLIYWVAVMVVMTTLKEMKMENINSEKMVMMKKWLMLTVMINLGGIPPMAGFVSKWIVFSESLKHNLLIITTMLLMISSINLYIYLRMTSSHIMKNSVKSPKVPNQPKKTFSMSIILMNSIPLMMLSF